jgi:hypothetical protein
LVLAGFDDLDMVELVMKIEACYDVHISDEAVSHVICLPVIPFGLFCETVHSHVFETQGKTLIMTSVEAKALDRFLSDERILCAAVLIPKGDGKFVAGYRHNDCYEILAMFGHDRGFMDFEGEGFLTNKNRFVSRSEAADIAKAKGQLICEYVPSELRSEDLY